MGKVKKENNRVAVQSAPDRATNVYSRGENFYRDAKKVKFVNMLKSGRAVRNARGEIIKAAPY